MTFMKATRDVSHPPLLDHPIDSPSVFRPEDLVADVRGQRRINALEHYLPASQTVEALHLLADALESEVRAVGLPVLRGLVWTTDAPYRETSEQLDRYARLGALAVEMQAASLFAFSAVRKVAVGVVAHVTNAPEQEIERFDKGSYQIQRELLYAVCRGAHRFECTSLNASRVSPLSTRH